MKSIIFRIEFLTNWHTGSGLMGSTDANLTVIKNSQGLPYIPGKTLKGLFREAAQHINSLHPKLISADFIETIFGVSDQKAGQCFFNNATLSKHVSETLEEEHKKHLFKVVSSTSIDANGVAKQQSLRQVEVTIPLVLYGSIEHFPDDPNTLDQMNFCFSWVKKMGVGRTRGFGRCIISLHA